MKDSANSLRLSYLTEKQMAEQWLVSVGVVSQSSVDTLLMYAYVHRGVEKVDLAVPQHELDDNGETAPVKDFTVTYRLKLETMALLKWKAVKKANLIKNSILRKSTLLALAKAGAPIGIEDSIKSMAVEYLPKTYKVEVTVIE